MLGKLVILTLLPFSSARRQRQGGEGHAEEMGAGTVTSLYTYGSPKTSAPAMTNLARSDGCFPGFRVVNTKVGWFTDDVDIVPALMVTTQYEHSKMKTLFLEEHGKSTLYQCGESKPRILAPSGLMHAPTVYIERASVYADSGLKAATKVGMKSSYLSDLNEVRSLARSQNWRLVGTSNDGEDVSHLFQHQDSKACQVTFEGSDSIFDWVTDVAIIRVSFCGLSQGVHLGFRNEVRRITKTSAWQTNIKTKLGGCSSVQAVGHSLGAAQATLFAACANSGKQGNNDYNQMGWTAGETVLYDEI